GLIAAGFAVHLANTAAIKQYEGLKYAGDERDELRDIRQPAGRFRSGVACK
ncbi:hypothetical protein HDG41_006540, partial [Paraburkholderia sp. JPY162]|nr:hypothetical protein [Paraburkholderia youngii]